MYIGLSIKACITFLCFRKITIQLMLPPIDDVVGAFRKELLETDDVILVSFSDDVILVLQDP